MPAATVGRCICRDWRLESADTVGELIEREASRWREDLLWDVRDSWRVIEPARKAGMLPGVVARNDAGDILGWSWFLSHQGCLQVAALVADDPHVVRSLVEAVRTSETATASRTEVWSVRGEPNGLKATLESAGLRVERYRYLIADLRNAAVGAGPEPPVRLMNQDDVPAAAALFARAYAASQSIRAFAPDGTVDAWESYVRSLVATNGCGTLLPEATLVVDGAGRLRAAAMCSSIDLQRRVSHLTQLAVDPASRGGGLGRALMEAAIARCAAAGYESMTLLVAANNTTACRLYEALGFEATGAFTVATSTSKDLGRRFN
jgi:ribosomal protein S18 acetylase RimI-like enzyme